MLKISVIDNRTQRKLVLAGTLIEPWVAELRTTWRWARVRPAELELVIDLKDVTRISEAGENVLLELMNDGAKFSSDGVLTKHMIRELASRWKRHAAQPTCAMDLGTQTSGGQK